MNDSPTDEIRFIASHRPALESGDYEIALRQHVNTGDPLPLIDTFEATRYVSVAGDRFELPPSAVGAEFPPAGSRGDHWHVFPHVVLNRSTLPWERTACDYFATDEPPWLVLLLFDDDELGPDDRKVVTVTDLATTVDGVRWTPVKPEVAQHPDDAVAVIDVAWKSVRAQLPTCRADAEYRCHTRTVTTAGLPDATIEVSVVMGNRLPARGRRSIAHLVSTETRYDFDSTTGDCSFHDAATLADDDRVRFVSLKSWDFYLPDAGDDGGKKTFIGLLEGLNTTTTGEASVQFGLAPADLSPLAGSPPWATAAWSADDADHDPVLGAVTDRLGNGFVPLRHHLRRGDHTVSWYHGPLVAGSPGPTAGEALLPANCSDALMVFDGDTGMFDVSYAAAWEIGRMLTLANTRLAVSLFNWKRTHMHALRSVRHAVDLGFHLPLAHLSSTPSVSDLDGEAEATLPPDLQRWFDDLSMLRDVPFSYLVPDERLLPPESLRFFTLDQWWGECLRDGAFSIGRVLQDDAERDAAHLAAMPATRPMIGLLIRSELISGYPELIVQAFGQRAEFTDADLEHSALDGNLAPILTCLRRDLLSPNVLFMLFDGAVKIVDVHLKPEALHFGLDLISPDDVPVDHRAAARTGLTQCEPAWLGKHLRLRDGQEVGKRVWPAAVGEFPAVTVSPERVVDFVALARAIAQGLCDDVEAAESVAPLDPAAFALEMVAGLDLIRFVRTGPLNAEFPR